MVTTLLPPFISLITPLIELCGTLMVTALHLWADEMNVVITVITTVMNPSPRSSPASARPGPSSGP
jgi:hypothetical protein